MKKNISLILALSIAVLATGCGKDSTSESVADTAQTTVAQTADATTESESEPAETQPEEIDPSMLEYSLVWEEEFEGTELNMDNWRYEVHQPGWVNHELQEYVTGDECVWVEDGHLVIQAKKIVKDNGDVTYKSGRINSRLNHDFKYGKIEASIQFPEGQGFLPAFWMMPTTESKYGSWPSCGEIDIAEVLGNETDRFYGTIHYGVPHNQTQFTYNLPEGESFATGYHTYGIEWEPGSIKWFVDGNMVGEANSWFTAMIEGNNRPYPAPFNQDFYIILNLAVGGDWPGNPDPNMEFGENAQMRVEWVRVYQRGYYDENVEEPEVVYNFREADSEGNFVVFDQWDFMTFIGGEGSADINEDEIVITTTNDGDVDYSIQLVNPGIPAVSGTTYEVTFEAKASEARSMNVTVSAPNKGYARYLPDTTLDLSTDWQTFTYTYTIAGDSDDSARLEFNMGNFGSTGTINLRNVVVKEA